MKTNGSLGCCAMILAACGSGSTDLGGVDVPRQQAQSASQPNPRASADGPAAPQTPTPNTIGAASWTVLSGDFTGDRKGDLVAIGHGDVANATRVANSTGQSFADAGSWISGWSAGGPSAWTILPGDFTGDGKTDLVALSTLSWDNPTYVADSKGTSFGNAGKWISGWSTAGPAAWTVLPGDFTGDGKTDLVALSPEAVDNPTYVASSTGSAFHNAGKWASGWAAGGPANWTVLPGDFTGDGKADLVAISTASSNNPTFVLNSAGTTFGNSAMWISGWAAGGASSWTILPGDFDGDGRTDLVAISPASSNNPTFVAISTGSGFVNAGQWIAGWSAGGPSAWTVLAEDYNGDGKTDLVAVPRNEVHGSIYVALSTGSNFVNAGQWIAGWTTP